MMAVANLYSNRQKELRGEYPDVYQYEELPNKFKVQVTQIIIDTIGKKPSYNQFGHSTVSLSEISFRRIHKILCKEYGVHSLAIVQGQTDIDAVLNFFMQTSSIEEAIDVIELTFRIINSFVRQNESEFKSQQSTIQTPTDAIIELNARFKQHGVGYEFVQNEIIRIDSSFLHSEVVKPTLHTLLLSPFLEGAKEEFLSAHSHYRHQRYKESLNDCLKAFESTLKAICIKHNWEHSPNDTSKRLLNICLTNGLVPAYMQEQFNQFLALLSSGVPTIRNKEAGHGQGTEVKNVSSDLVSYALHLTASNILFLSGCERKI